MLVVAVDFDGTITKKQEYPEVGEINDRAIEVLKKMQKKYTLCLWTCREGKELDDAIKALKERGLEFKYVNESPYESDCRKIIADVYIDDRALGGITDWDIIEDFFLYLRESGHCPYQSLRRIKRKDTFETWLLNTFRNYLNGRAKAEDKIYATSYSDNVDGNSQQSLLTDERKLAFASQLIAYAHQSFYPRGRFIFLRSLLTMLNKQKALPNEEIAQALGMTNIAYRVTVHRMKCNLANFRTRLIHGEQLRLDTEHQQMAQRLYNDFVHLYPILLTYYNQTIDTLKCANAIRQLRHEYYEATGMMLHEPESYGPVHVTITGFWNKLNRMLIY